MHSKSQITQNEKDDSENLFYDRPFEEVEGRFYDEGGFYMTPNGSFWDLEQTYFNSLGFDSHGGSYDKYGVYIRVRI